ncbi:hypothetical protein [Dietzia natronolimnaea]|uniref:hypothetical protein n=1 Tax=Dietzia natronolimnaea TaxID=161920 RepID=UPI0015FB2560|nr:hypothetical protein [Dietzia natronolimnaea]MBB1037348.1 hypothetical protein [Dietzia natronolimnaea]
MKKIIDRAFAAFIAIVAIFAGLAVAESLLRPFMATIVTVAVIVVGVATLIFVVPVLLGAGSNLAEKFRNGRWDRS